MLAINKAANSIAYPPVHLGGLDSSSRISNDSDVASEKFRGVLCPDLGKSSRKKVFFSKEYLHKEKRRGPLPPATQLSNGQKNCEKICTVCEAELVLRITLLQMLRRNAVLKLLQGCHLVVSIGKISKNHQYIQK